MAINKGTRANHAIYSTSNPGKHKTSNIAEKNAKSICLIHEENQLFKHLNTQLVSFINDGTILLNPAINH